MTYCTSRSALCNQMCQPTHETGNGRERKVKDGISLCQPSAHALRSANSRSVKRIIFAPLIPRALAKGLKNRIVTICLTLRPSSASLYQDSGDAHKDQKMT
jgi:hypothetical protein